MNSFNYDKNTDILMRQAYDAMTIKNSNIRNRILLSDQILLFGKFEYESDHSSLNWNGWDELYDLDLSVCLSVRKVTQDAKMLPSIL